MAEEQTTWLSRESFERLSAELERLQTEGRKEIAQRIEAAREEGDLRENGGYHAAREEQSKMEGRILELTHLLENAKVGDAPQTVDAVAPGTIVTAEIGGETERFLLGSRHAAADVDIEVYPESAPLGKAIMGLKEGESTTFKAPNGRGIKVTITKIEPFI